MSDHITPPCPCPACGKPGLNRALDAAADSPGPQSGDLTVCFYCAAMLTFKKDLTLRRISRKELERLRPVEQEKLLTLAGKIAVSLGERSR